MFLFIVFEDMLQAREARTLIYICKAKRRRRQASALVKVSVRDKWVVNLIKDDIESKDRRYKYESGKCSG